MIYPNTQLPEGIAQVELYEHNEKTYEEAKGQLKLYGKTAIVQPTGTGKSMILKRFLQDFYYEWKIVVGSSAQALDLLQDEPDWVSNSTLVTTYHSLEKIVNDLEVMQGVIKIKLIVLDELQRAGAKTWNPVITKLVQLFPDAGLLGLTATPIRFLDKRRDMVSELFNGISAGNITLQKAVELGILPQFDCAVGMYDIQNDIKDRLKKLNKRKVRKGESEEAVNARILHRKIQLDSFAQKWDRDEKIVGMMQQYLKQHRDKNYKHIVFTPSIEIAEHMRGLIEGWYSKAYNDGLSEGEQSVMVRTYMYHSKNPDRKFEFNCFESDKGAGSIDVLISVNMASNSFHVKNTKSIMLLRSIDSPNLLTQMIGRGLASGGENVVIFDLVDNLKAADNMQELIYSMESKVNGLSKDRKYEVLTKQHKKSTRICKSYTDTTSDVRDIMGYVDAVLADKWQTNMNSLIAYIYNSEQEITSATHITDPELYTWLVAQQKAFVQGKLTNEKDEQFKRLGRLAYLTPAFEQYDGASQIDLVDAINEHRNTHDASYWQLTYRLYCGFLPLELEKYIQDIGLDIDLSEEWFKEVCVRCNRGVTDKFYATLNTILNDESIRVGDAVYRIQNNLQPNFSFQRYYDTICTILNLQARFNEFVNPNVHPESSLQVVLVNMLSKYWRVHFGEISSKIETNPGILEIHKKICEYCLGIASQQSIQELTTMLSTTTPSQRYMSINKLLFIMQSLESNRIA